MERVIMEGGLLIEPFVLEPKKEEAPEDSIVEIRIEDIKSDDDDLSEYNTGSDNMGSYGVLEKYPLVDESEEQEIKKETDSDSDCDVVVNWEETRNCDIDITPKTEPEHLIINYQNSSPVTLITDKSEDFFIPALEDRIIQERSEHSGQGLLFSILNSNTSNVVNQWSNSNSSNNQLEIEGILENPNKEHSVTNTLVRKEENYDIEEESNENNLLFKLLTVKKEDSNNVKTQYLNIALSKSIQETNINSNSTSGNTSPMLFTPLSNEKNSSLGNYLPETELKQVMQTSMDLVLIPNSRPTKVNLDETFNKTNLNTIEQNKSFLNTSLQIPNKINISEKDLPEKAEISNNPTQKGESVVTGNNVKIIVHENKHILFGLKNKITTQGKNSVASEKNIHCSSNDNDTQDVLCQDETSREEQEIHRIQENEISHDSITGRKETHENVLGKNRNDIIIHHNCDKESFEIQEIEKGQENVREEEKTDKIMINQKKWYEDIMKECLTSRTVKKKKKGPVKKEKCPHCQLSLISSSLKMHILYLHTAEKDKKYFRCSDCDFKALNKLRLNEHIISKHTNAESMMDKMMKCDKCPKMFKSLKRLKIHMPVHEKNRPILRCANCDFTTIAKTSLLFHVKEHMSPEKEHKCPFCDYKSTSRTKAIRHKYYVHHNRNVFQCHICSFTSKLKPPFTSHLMTHKEVLDDKDCKYRCDKCDYKTYRQYSLQIHKLNHLTSDEIQYFYCYHCNFKANRKGNLRNHILKQHIIKNTSKFSCIVCDFTTANKQVLIRHIDKHAKDEEKEK